MCTLASHGLRDVKQNVKILSVCIHKSTHRLLDLYVDCVIKPQYRVLFFDPLECTKEAIHVTCFDPQRAIEIVMRSLIHLQ